MSKLKIFDLSLNCIKRNPEQPQKQNDKLRSDKLGIIILLILYTIQVN